MEAHMIQGSPEWLAFRKLKIGASEAAAIMGISPYMTKLQLWEQKLGLSPERLGTPAMERGKQLESVALEMYNTKYSKSLSPHVVVSQEYPWMMASFDGYDVEKGSEAIEIKCLSVEDHELAIRGSIPRCYMVQLQHQMVVSGLRLVSYVSYHPTHPIEMHVIEVPRDDVYCAKIVAAEKSFYELLTTFTAPDPEDRDFANREDVEWFEAAMEWANAKRKLSDAKDNEQKFRTVLISLASGRSAKGCGVRVTKYQKQGQIDYSRVEALSEVDLEKYRKPASECWRVCEE